MEPALGSSLAVSWFLFIYSDCSTKNRKCDACGGRLSIPMSLRPGPFAAFGKLGAHDHEDRVTEEDVPMLLDFLEVFLMHLYFVPAKIAAIQEKHRRLHDYIDQLSLLGSNGGFYDAKGQT
jgi:hypothetical protein